jgi:prevent-host-death family protein
METVNAIKVKENFFDYLDKAEQGHTIVIQRQGHDPVKLVPIKEADWRDKMTIEPKLLVSEEEAFAPMDDIWEEHV